MEDGMDGGLAFDYGALREAESQIAATADALDEVGGRIPSGDYGEADVLVATLLAAYTEAATLLVSEGKVLALGVRLASTGMEATDAEQALDFMEVGRS